MKLKLITILTVLILNSVFAQSETEIYLIDSYVTPEAPHKFILSYFTSDSTESKVEIDDEYAFIVSEELTDFHEIEIDVTKMEFDSSHFSFHIFAENEEGTLKKSQVYFVELPFELEIKGGKNPKLLTICFGGIIFALPSPTYVNANGNDYFALSKEIPVLSFYSIGYNYPVSYIGLEYTHIFNTENNDLLRLGYKYIFQPPYVEFISPGVSVFSNIAGYSGAGAELSLGLFEISVFTVYTRYRYNFEFKNTENDFHEISLGLYSSFFSFNF